MTTKEKIQNDVRQYNNQVSEELESNNNESIRLYEIGLIEKKDMLRRHIENFTKALNDTI